MQHLLVGLIVAAAIFFLGRRLWQFFKSDRTITCGCGCSGCSTDVDIPASHRPFPMYKG
jgi:hypothetical protein